MILLIRIDFRVAALPEVTQDRKNTDGDYLDPIRLLFSHDYT